ncbi:MAG: DUF3592 domain-containing protein [Kangiellaceae bacterium]|nr:DUF3592 domain-containing protein [Kangiellaceae bacterium]
MSSNRQPKASKINRKVIYSIWFFTALSTLAYGWFIFDNLSYIGESESVTATVHKKTSHRSRTVNSKQYSTAYNIVYRYENPYVPGKMELESELAPVMYALFEEGETVEVYFNDKNKQKSRLSYPLHFWLMPIVWAAFLSFGFLVSKLLSKTNGDCYQNYKKFKIAAIFLFLLPGAITFIQSSSSEQLIAEERQKEANWPHWYEFERAVPKPVWWDTVAFKYFDPMNYTSEEYSGYVKNNTGSDKAKRQFKVAYAFLLLHQDDPLQMGWDLARGTSREFMPLYEFFLERYMQEQWQGECSRPCSDATQMVEMAGDLLSMKLDENQIESSLELINNIMKYKYDRGNNRGKYYFLYSHRRYLEQTESVEKAHHVLDRLVEENLQEAISLDLKTQTRKWSTFWNKTQRTVGMFSVIPSNNH